jgi:hypothetical protein
VANNFTNDFTDTINHLLHPQPGCRKVIVSVKSSVKTTHTRRHQVQRVTRDLNMCLFLRVTLIYISCISQPTRHLLCVFRLTRVPEAACPLSSTCLYYCNLSPHVRAHALCLFHRIAAACPSAREWREKVPNWCGPPWQTGAGPNAENYCGGTPRFVRN